MNSEKLNRNTGRSKCSNCHRYKLRNSHGSLAEFGPALILFFAMVLGLSLFFVRYGVSTAAMFYIVDHAADVAGKAPSFDLASKRARLVVSESSETPLSRFCGISRQCIKNVTVSVEEHVTTTGAVNELSRDQLLHGTIDPEGNTYEYKCGLLIPLRRLLPVASVPWLRQVPALFAPATITISAKRIVEIPDGLMPNSFGWSRP